MAQQLHNITVTVTTAGTRVRVITDANSPYRYRPWAFFFAPATNTGLVCVGGASVSMSGAVYTISLDGTTMDNSFNWNAFQFPNSPNPNETNRNMIDLYNTWVDAATNGDKVLVSVNLNS